MTSDRTLVMLAVLVLEFVTVLATGVRQDHRVVLGLFEAAAEAHVLGHLVLGVGEVAIRAGPVIESQEAFHGALGDLFLFAVLITMVLDYTTLLFLLVLADVLLERLVEFLDPALDAAKMEGLAALLAVPEGAALVDRVVADHALLLTLGKRLN